MTVTVPGHLCWPVHRIATAGVYTDPLATILDRWTLADVVDANAVIDALDEARARAAKG